MKVKEERAFDKNLDLLKRYRMGDSLAGEELFLLNRPLIYSITARFSGRGFDSAELFEIGVLGLVKAINTFDFSRECAFSTYAVPLIFGEIRRFLRDDGMIKVSRELKKTAAQLAAERERRLSCGEDAGIVSIAAAVGVPPEDAALALFSTAPVRSLDESAFDEDDGQSIAASVFDEDEGPRSFEKLAIRFAIDKLAPLHRKIVILRYFRDFSQAECARILGLTQVKISREEKKILAQLKEELA